MKRTKLMEREISRASHVITLIGTGMAYGYLDIGAGNESLLQLALAGMIANNDKKREVQEKAFQEYPWLKSACGK